MGFVEGDRGRMEFEDCWISGVGGEWKWNGYEIKSLCLMLEG